MSGSVSLKIITIRNGKECYAYKTSTERILYFTQILKNNDLYINPSLKKLMLKWKTLMTFTLFCTIFVVKLFQKNIFPRMCSTQHMYCEKYSFKMKTVKLFYLKKITIVL